MPWLFAALAGIGAVEVLLRLPLAQTVRRCGQLATKVRSVVSSKHISDHWKEQVIPAYAGRLFGLTLLIGAYLILILLPTFMLLALAAVLKIPFLEFTVSLSGLTFISVVAIGYAQVRTRVGA